KHSREKTTKTAVSDMVLSQTDSVHQKPPEEDFEKPEDPGDLNTAIASIVEKAKAQSATHEVTDQEIETLLREAQFKIRAEKALKDSRNTVNADVLLQEVEMELDKSLKERVFDAIKNGPHQARVMLANRGH